jgi:hypothetical protein
VSWGGYAKALQACSRQTLDQGRIGQSSLLFPPPNLVLQSDAERRNAGRFGSERSDICQCQITACPAIQAPSTELHGLVGSFRFNNSSPVGPMRPKRQRSASRSTGSKTDRTFTFVTLHSIDVSQAQLSVRRASRWQNSQRRHLSNVASPDLSVKCQRRYKMGPATGLKVGQSIQTKSLSLRLGLIGVGEAAVA